MKTVVSMEDQKIYPVVMINNKIGAVILTTLVFLVIMAYKLYYFSKRKQAYLLFSHFIVLHMKGTDLVLH